MLWWPDHFVYALLFLCGLYVVFAVIFVTVCVKCRASGGVVACGFLGSGAIGGTGVLLAILCAQPESVRLWTAIAALLTEVLTVTVVSVAAGRRRRGKSAKIAFLPAAALALSVLFLGFMGVSMGYSIGGYSIRFKDARYIALHEQKLDRVLLIASVSGDVTENLLTHGGYLAVGEKDGREVVLSIAGRNKVTKDAWLFAHTCKEFVDRLSAEGVCLDDVFPEIRRLEAERVEEGTFPSLKEIPADNGLVLYIHQTKIGRYTYLYEQNGELRLVTLDYFW